MNDTVNKWCMSTKGWDSLKGPRPRVRGCEGWERPLTVTWLTCQLLSWERGEGGRWEISCSLTDISAFGTYLYSGQQSNWPSWQYWGYVRRENSLHDVCYILTWVKVKGDSQARTVLLAEWRDFGNRTKRTFNLATKGLKRFITFAVYWFI